VVVPAPLVTPDVSVAAARDARVDVDLRSTDAGIGVGRPVDGVRDRATVMRATMGYGAFVATAREFLEPAG
jgi:hypothetical protein